MILELLLCSGLAYAAHKYYRSTFLEATNTLPSTASDKNSAVKIPAPEEFPSTLTLTSEREINMDLTVVSVSMCLSILGNLGYTFLGILSVPGLLFVGIPVFEKAFQSMKKGEPDVSIPYTWSSLACIALGFYGTGSLGAFFYVVSRKLLSKLKKESKEDLVGVFGQYPEFVWLVVNGIESRVPFETIKAGDVIAVHAGEKIPADGLVIEGSASVDQHSLTGEAQPVEKDIGSLVFATTVILTGKMLIRVDNAGETTIAAQIAKILEQTTHCKTEAQLRADTLTRQTIFPTLIVGGLSLPVLGPVGATAVLNAHFGYRMSVISSIVMLTYLRVISQEGILLKDAKVLDTLSKVDTLVFDKTGTLTLSKPYVGQIYTAEGWHEEAILKLAATAEYRQHHPVALAILHEVYTRKLDVVPTVEDTHYEIGYGLSACLGEQIIYVGSQRFMEKQRCRIPIALAQAETSAQARGYSLVMVALDTAVIGALELHPTLRPGVQDAITQLREHFPIKEMYILSGDTAKPTENLAQLLGITSYFANVLPQEKANIIETLHNSGKTVCYIGDGINDAIALKKAHVSISLQGASSVAIDTAQIVLMNENLEQLVTLFKISKEFEQTMQSSLNQILVPSLVGATGAFFFNFTIIDTLILKQIGLTTSLISSVRPLKHR